METEKAGKAGTNMKRKFAVILFTAASIAAFAACAAENGSQIEAGQEESSQSEASAEQSAQSQEQPAEQSGQEQDAQTETPDYEYPAEDAGTVLQESRLGYSMTWDPTVFTLDDTGESDIYTYNTSESLDGPVYIAVQAYPDMDAAALADGLVLQSGEDGVTAEDTYFGADGLETKCVYIEKETDGVTQAQVFYAVPDGDGSLLVEISGYVGMPDKAQAKLEEMLGTFSLN